MSFLYLVARNFDYSYDSGTVEFCRFHKVFKKHNHSGNSLRSLQAPILLLHFSV